MKAARPKFKRKLRLRLYNPVVIRERKLGRERDRKGYSRYCFGQHYADGLIEIDPRQQEQTRLDTLCHELLHHVDPDNGDPAKCWSENRISEAAYIFAKALWESGYRRVKL